MSRLNEFLNYYPSELRATLENLISSIRVVGLSQLQDDLIEAVFEHVSESVNPERAFIIDPVIGYDDLKKWHKKYLGELGEGKLPKDPRDTRFYLDVEPSSVFHDESGSEHFSAVVRRESRRRISRKIGKNVVFSFDEARTASDLHLVLIVDNSGSGKQIIDFVRNVASSCREIMKTDKACWKNVLLKVIVWGATRTAIQAIYDEFKDIDECFKLDITYLNYINTIYDYSDDKLLQSVEDLLKAHSPISRSTYSNIGSLTVFEGNSCPNNLPKILYMDESETHIPLFVNKYVSSNIAHELRGRYAAFSKPEFKDNHNSRFKARGFLRVWKVVKSLAEPFYMYLCYLVVRDEFRVARALLNASYSEKLEIIHTASALGYVDDSHKITKRGVEALRNYERRSRHKTIEGKQGFYVTEIAEFDQPYYPTSIDGAAIHPGSA